MENVNLSNGYSVTRESIPGQPSGLLVEFERRSKAKARHSWTDEDHASFKKTGFLPKENVDLIRFTFDGGLNSHARKVMKMEDGESYLDPDTFEITDDLIKYSKQWARYQKGLTGAEQQEGYPLKVYFVNDPAKIEHYAHFKVYTVEQLAGMPESTKQLIGLGAIMDSKAAQEFLAKVGQDGPIQAQAEEMEKLKAKMEAQSALIEQLMQANKAGKSVKRKRGPNKVKTEVSDTQEEV